MKTLTSIALVIFMASCASTKMAQVPVGIWDYSITGTPNGNFSGDFIVSLADGKYAALLKSQAGEISLQDPLFDKSTKKFTGTFYFEGNTIFFESTTTGDSMTGTVSAGGMNFPFKAKRKK